MITTPQFRRYSGVLRAPGSYVPPGARKGLGAQATIASAKKSQQDSAPSEPPAQDETADTTTVTDAEPSQAPTAMEASAPKAVTGTPLPSKVLRTGAATFVPSRESTPVESGGDQAGEGAAKPPTPTVSVTKVVSATNGQPAEVAGVFKKFVGMEKEKILNRRQDLARLGREEKLAELRAFSENFKVCLFCSRGDCESLTSRIRSCVFLRPVKKQRRTPHRLVNPLRLRRSPTRRLPPRQRSLCRIKHPHRRLLPHQLQWSLHQTFSRLPISPKRHRCPLRRLKPRQYHSLGRKSMPCLRFRSGTLPKLLHEPTLLLLLLPLTAAVLVGNRPQLPPRAICLMQPARPLRHRASSMLLQRNLSSVQVLFRLFLAGRRQLAHRAVATHRQKRMSQLLLTAFRPLTAQKDLARLLLLLNRQYPSIPSLD